MDRDDFLKLWERLEMAFGSPAQKQLRFKGLFRELHKVSYAEADRAVGAWIAGDGDEQGFTGRRFPYPADLLKLVYRHRRERRPQGFEHRPDGWQAFSSMSLPDLEEYMKTLERHWQKLWLDRSGDLSLPDQVLKNMMALQFSLTKHELEKRRNK